MNLQLVPMLNKLKYKTYFNKYKWIRKFHIWKISYKIYFKRHLLSKMDVSVVYLFGKK